MYIDAQEEVLQSDSDSDDSDRERAPVSRSDSENEEEESLPVFLWRPPKTLQLMGAWEVHTKVRCLHLEVIKDTTRDVILGNVGDTYSKVRGNLYFKIYNL